MRVAVLGGTGFIGRHVAGSLADAGADVTTIQRSLPSRQDPRVRALQADRTQPSALTAALAAAAPALLVDMIAYTGRDVERLLVSLPDSLERLVVISSGDVYWTYGAFLGFGPAHPPASALDERAPLREQLHPYRALATSPDDVRYDYDKIVVERAARSGAEVPVTVLRLPMVYGPGDPQRRVSGVLDRLSASDGTLHLNAAEAGWRCSRGYVEDVAHAVRLAALDGRASGETFNVGEADALTELEWVRAIAAAAGWQGRVIRDPAAPSSLPAVWEISLVVDTRKIRATLDYREPVGREDGLRRALAT